MSSLEGLGFAREQALEALKVTGSSSSEQLLQTLLVITDPSELPRVFALQGSGASEREAVVLVRATDAAAAGDQAAAPSDRQLAIEKKISQPASGAAREGHVGARPPGAAVRPQQAAAGTAAKKKGKAGDAQKSWILASLEHEDDSSPRSSASGGGASEVRGRG